MLQHLLKHENRMMAQFDKMQHHEKICPSPESLDYKEPYPKYSSPKQSTYGTYIYLHWPPN